MKSTPHDSTRQGNEASRRYGTPTPLVQGAMSGALSRSDDESASRREEYTRRRAERQARHEERERREMQENRTRIMLASAFLCAGICLGVMTRLGENLLSSVVYGAMIGLFIDLLGAVAIALLGMSDSLGWGELPADVLDGYEDDLGEADFAGLGNAMLAPFSASDPRDVPMTASFVPLGQDGQKAISDGSKDDMQAFIETLASDAGRQQDDFLV